MDVLELKSILSTFVLPPAGPLLLVAAGLLVLARRRRAGLWIAWSGAGLGWLLCTNAVAVLLAQVLLPQTYPIRSDQLKSAQAIVVLGGGVLPEAPEYGEAQPGAPTLARLRYGLWLGKASGLPVGFAGGVGWSASHTPIAPEGAIARRVARQEFGRELRWVDERSRDTRENALRMAELLRPAGIQRIALVTHSWHMPRAAAHFRAQGLQVIEAPTGFPGWQDRLLLEWLPSTHGLETSRVVIREWLGLRLAPPG